MDKQPEMLQLLVTALSKHLTLLVLHRQPHVYSVYLMSLKAFCIEDQHSCFHQLMLSICLHPSRITCTITRCVVCNKIIIQLMVIMMAVGKGGFLQ